MIQALVFDFDGLILETEEPIFLSWQELYRQYDCELLLSDWVKIIGTANMQLFDPLRTLENQIGHRLDRKNVLPLRQLREQELIAQRNVQPGILAALQRARQLGLKMAVASSSPRAWVVGHLSRLGLLSYFGVIKTGDDVRRTKPDPELYQVAVQLLAVQPNQALAFEDSPNGILAARRAGLHCVAIPGPLTAHLDLSRADLLLKSLADRSLDDLIQHFGSNGHAESALAAASNG